MKDVVIVDGYRTPYAKAGTAFKDLHAVDLGAGIIKEVVSRTDIDRDRIDEVIVGNAGMPADAANIARVIEGGRSAVIAGSAANWAMEFNGCDSWVSIPVQNKTANGVGCFHEMNIGKAI